MAVVGPYDFYGRAQAILLNSHEDPYKVCGGTARALVEFMYLELDMDQEKLRGYFSALIEEVATEKPRFVEPPKKGKVVIRSKTPPPTVKPKIVIRKRK